jgi:peptidoglycan/LPS O-acetylase OafA/YrhL
MPASRHVTRQYAFIDALRGYAVLLVITCHTSYAIPGLPYPVKKIAVLGWHGVQLFFLMSCVTLLLSWHADERRQEVSLWRFWLRRLFRIVPMYWLAALFYFWLIPPSTGIVWHQVMTALTFTNIWSPAQMSTVPGGWIVVPGGWSVSVEFAFYALFPVLALLIRTMRRAVLFFALSRLAACAANTFMRPALAGSFGEVAVKIFLYFWFPNQLPVFALGTILFFAIRPGLEGFPGRMTRFARRRGTWIILACMSVVPFVAGKPFPQSLPFAPPLYVPLFLVASGLFMVAVSCMAARPDSVFVNAPIRALGKVSFSAYLFHFALLRVLPPWLPKPLGAAATSWMAILSFVALWMAVVTATFALSFVTYRLVEKPMIKAGNRLLARRNTAAAPLPLGVQH